MNRLTSSQVWVKVCRWQVWRREKGGGGDRQRANESSSCFSRIVNPLPNISCRDREKISRAHVFHYFATLSLQMNELDLHEAVARNLAIISHLARPGTELAIKQRPLAFTFGPCHV